MKFICVSNASIFHHHFWWYFCRKKTSHTDDLHTLWWSFNTYGPVNHHWAFQHRLWHGASVSFSSSPMDARSSATRSGPSSAASSGTCLVICPGSLEGKKLKGSELDPCHLWIWFGWVQYSQIKVRSHSGLCLLVWFLPTFDLWEETCSWRLDGFISIVDSFGSKCTWSLFVWRIYWNICIYMNIIHIQYIDILYPNEYFIQHLDSTQSCVWPRHSSIWRNSGTIRKPPWNKGTASD